MDIVALAWYSLCQSFFFTPSALLSGAQRENYPWDQNILLTILNARILDP
jgi:hypothetical protein